MRIVNLTEDKIDGVVDLLLQFHVEAHQKTIKVNPDKLRESLGMMIADKEHSAMRVVIKNDKVIGLYCLSREDLWSDEYLGYLFWFYIHPNYRNGRIALKLIKDCIQTSDDMDIKILYAASTAGISAANHRAFEGLLSRVGFLRDVGTWYRVKE